MQFIDLKAQRERLGSKIDDALLKVVNHGKYIMGPEVTEFEGMLKEFSGAKNAISCSNGTDAITMPLMAKGIGRGDAVFVPSFTFAATAEVVALAGATPIFVDVDSKTFNLDDESLKAGLSLAKEEGLMAKAVIPVGLFGQPADIDAIKEISDEESMFIIDDAAQSFGGTYKGRKVGTLGDATSTSFFPAKPLGCYGDGGAVFTDDDELADIIRSIRVHGKGDHKYDNVRIGLNARLDTIQAAILIEKIKIFPDELEKRQVIASLYNNALREVVGVPNLGNDVTSAWAQYTIVAEDRSAIQEKLNNAKIPNVVYYPLPLHQQTAYRHYPIVGGKLKTCEYLAQHVMSLPMHPYLSPEDQEKVIEAFL
ncbi:MAG: DegT/DnrJ/EryC1/StrS family aminotransferase [Sphingomonadales bacterium]|jgi:dTDP-4-amino-4,6-dideoxygalactose transaminase